MAKRIKVNPPRGLSKTKRKIEDLHGLMPKLNTDNASDQGEYAYLAHLARELKKGPQATPPSSTRKKVPKEGNRKFVGPRQYSNELSENRGVRNDNTPREHRSYLRELRRQLIERDDPTVDAYESGVGQIRGGLNSRVVAKLKAAVRKIMAKPEREMTDRERKFIRTIDSTGHFLGNYDEPTRD